MGRRGKKRIPKQTSVDHTSRKAEIWKHASQVRGGSKTVSSTAKAPVSLNQQQFRWSAKQIDHGIEGAWDWDLTPKELYDFMCFIEECEKLTWGEIVKQTTGGKKSHKKHHEQDIEGLCSEAKERLVMLQRSNREFEKVFRFRLSGKLRIWGYREGSLFHLIWYDRNHKVYPTEPR